MGRNYSATGKFERNTTERGSIMENERQVTWQEKVAVIVVFGALALYSLYQGNELAASGYATALATYYMSRAGV